MSGRSEFETRSIEVRAGVPVDAIEEVAGERGVSGAELEEARRMFDLWKIFESWRSSGDPQDAASAIAAAGLAVHRSGQPRVDSAANKRPQPRTSGSHPPSLGRGESLPAAETPAAKDLACLRKPDVFKALGQETRLNIYVLLLMSGRRTVTQVAEASGITMTAVSQHLAQLKAVGLITAERRGNEVWYSAEGQKFLRWVEEIRSAVEAMSSHAATTEHELDAVVMAHS